MPRNAMAILTLSALLLPACTPRPDSEHPMNADTAPIAALLDSFHAAAASADESTYFACFDEQGVFLGTDATERWTVPEFRAYAKPHFDKGQGWTYIPRAGNRHIRLAADGVAYFDELLDNEKYGVCRGTGVVVLSGSTARWRIRHYSLSFMVPNDLAGEVSAITKRTKP